MVPRVILRASRTGKPEAARVPKVRQTGGRHVLEVFRAGDLQTADPSSTDWRGRRPVRNQTAAMVPTVNTSHQLLTKLQWQAEVGGSGYFKTIHADQRVDGPGPRRSRRPRPKPPARRRPCWDRWWRRRLRAAVQPSGRASRPIASTLHSCGQRHRRHASCPPPCRQKARPKTVPLPTRIRRLRLFPPSGQGWRPVAYRWPVCITERACIRANPHQWPWPDHEQTPPIQPCSTKVPNGTFFFLLFDSLSTLVKSVTISFMASSAVRRNDRLLRWFHCLERHPKARCSETWPWLRSRLPHPAWHEGLHRWW